MSSLLLLLVLHYYFLLPLASSALSTPIRPQQSPPQPPASSRPEKNVIRVSPVETNEDILSLADLRFREWIGETSNPPNLSSFRLATAEIFHERNRAGSVVLLATMPSSDGHGHVTVGAAELSPIELQGVYDDGLKISSKSDQNGGVRPLYISDVVISSAYRRLGIGSQLMSVVEKTAWDLGSQLIVLNVERNNHGAIQFYDRMGYAELDSDTAEVQQAGDAQDGIMSFSLEDEGLLTPEYTKPGNKEKNLFYIDVRQLAINAGTTGQLIMMKKLSAPTWLHGRHDVVTPPLPTSASSTKVLGGTGFGDRNIKRRKKKRKR